MGFPSRNWRPLPGVQLHFIPAQRSPPSASLLTRRSVVGLSCRKQGNQGYSMEVTEGMDYLTESICTELRSRENFGCRKVARCRIALIPAPSAAIPCVAAEMKIERHAFSPPSGARMKSSTRDCRNSDRVLLDGEGDQRARRTGSWHRHGSRSNDRHAVAG